MTIHGIAQEDWKQIQFVLHKFPEVKQAILYGSRAKGTFHLASDIDITLKGNLNLQILADIGLDLDDLFLPYKFDISIFQQIDNQELIKHIENVGVDIYFF